MYNYGVLRFYRRTLFYFSPDMGHAYLLFTLILYNVSKRRNHVFKKEMIAKASDFFTDQRGYVITY